MGSVSDWLSSVSKCSLEVKRAHMHFKKCRLSTWWKLNVFNCNSLVGSSVCNGRITELLSGILIPHQCSYLQEKIIFCWHCCLRVLPLSCVILGSVSISRSLRGGILLLLSFHFYFYYSLNVNKEALVWDCWGILFGNFSLALWNAGLQQLFPISQRYRQSAALGFEDPEKCSSQSAVVWRNQAVV